MNHLGVEVISTDEVSASQTRLADEGLATVTEAQTACCYAVQDGVWIRGPGCEPREIYTVLADAEMTAAKLTRSRPASKRVAPASPPRTKWRPLAPRVVEPGPHVNLPFRTSGGGISSLIELPIFSLIRSSQ
jgi:hypothetical protein